MKLISWNVAGRVRLIPNQIDAIRKLSPDIVALQEVRASTREILREGLVQSDLRHVLDSFELASDPGQLTGPRRLGELIASRWPVTAIALGQFDIPWPERVLSAHVECPWGTVEVHTTHIPPGSSNGWIKVDTLEGIFRRLAIVATTHRILCGDFNTPREEAADGTMVTWGSGARGARWDAAERSVLTGLAAYDLRDVYRLLHGYAVSDFSHYSRGRGRRYDHVFASESLGPKRCR